MVYILYFQLQIRALYFDFETHFYTILNQHKIHYYNQLYLKKCVRGGGGRERESSGAVTLNHFRRLLMSIPVIVSILKLF